MAKEKTDKKVAACYCRVSTQRQAERHTIGQQIRLVPKIARSHGYSPYPSLYVDDGISGERIEERPAFQKLLADASKNV
jgi:DNA invertase Pin-like site-specific DNA recombinase